MMPQLNIDIGRITDDHIAIGYIDGTMLIIQECRNTADQHIKIPVTALLYAIQEYQKVYPIKAKIDPAGWKGIYGHSPASDMPSPEFKTAIDTAQFEENKNETK